MSSRFGAAICEEKKGADKVVTSGRLNHAQEMTYVSQSQQVDSGIGTVFKVIISMLRPTWILPRQWSSKSHTSQSPAYENFSVIR